MPNRRSLRLMRAAFALAVAGMTAACFQPVYGEKPGTAGLTVANQLTGVSIEPVRALTTTGDRVAGELQNNLISALQAGTPTPSTHRLRVTLTTQVQSVIVNTQTARPDVENYGINATFDLIELATGRSVLNGQTTARVSYDIPGGQQRFARTRALRDSENRAAAEIADNIRTRLAAYFVTKS